MLRLGVFEGKYLNDCIHEFPREWYKSALKADKLRPDKADPSVNLFGIKSRQSLATWRRNGWIPVHSGSNLRHNAVSARHNFVVVKSHAMVPRDTVPDYDVRGWFQWYCRYWIGRRIPEIDKIQIARWKAFARHAGQIRASYRRGSRPITRAQKMKHRPKQRQALLQWAYNPFM
jgi:hypothetical protein